VLDDILRYRFHKRVVAYRLNKYRTVVVLGRCRYIDLQGKKVVLLLEPVMYVLSCLTSFKTHVSRGFRLTAQCLVALIGISRAYVLSHSTVSLENSETLVGFSMRRDSDSVMAQILCNLLRDGEIVIFDKAYVHFQHLYKLMQRGVLWVTRAKSNMSYRIVKKLKRTHDSIVLDAKIKLAGHKSKKDYPECFRLIIADVVRNGKIVRMEFITDDFDLAASTICDLYKARWDIELFFKQLKQTLKLSDFLGYSENAVQWQIWMALLTYVIVRFLAYTSKWKGTFARLFTTVRGVMWCRIDLNDLLKKCCGTAPDRQRVCAQPQQLYLPLFA